MQQLCTLTSRNLKIPLGQLQSRLTQNIYCRLMLMFRSFFIQFSISLFTCRYAIGPPDYWGQLRDHPYITSAYFWTFLEPPTHHVSINTLLNVSKNGSFLNPPTQSIYLRNVWMVPNMGQEFPGMGHIQTHVRSSYWIRFHIHMGIHIFFQPLFTYVVFLEISVLYHVTTTHMHCR